LHQHVYGDVPEMQLLPYRPLKQEGILLVSACFAWYCPVCRTWWEA